MPKAATQSSRPGDDQTTYVARKRPDRLHQGRYTQETLDKMRQAEMGEKNPQWRGETVGYHAIHNWITSRKPKPAKCEHCGQKPPYDLANISGEYKRDVNDWKWLCRSCHMHEDGRINNLTPHPMTGDHLS